MTLGGRLKELAQKYGKVAIGVHLSVSFASIAGLYAAIKNNVDVESVLHKVGLSSGVEPVTNASTTGDVIDDAEFNQEQQGMKKKNRTAELVASSGGALALAVLCNKALIPVRVPITIALTPPIARFLARRNLLKNSPNFHQDHHH